MLTVKHLKLAVKKVVYASQCLYVLVEGLESSQRQVFTLIERMDDMEKCDSAWKLMLTSITLTDFFKNE